MNRRPRALFPAAAYDVLVLAASAGGILVLRDLFAGLPADLPASIVLVQHLSPRQWLLADVLQRFARTDVRWAEHGGRLRAGRIHVSPPGQHLSFAADGAFVLDDGARVNGLRPAADVTLASAAERFGPRTLAAVLTGYGNDGCAGAQAVRDAGGVVLVQDPATCAAPGMPASVIAAGAQSLVLPPDALVAAISSLVMVRGAAQLLGLRRTRLEHVPRQRRRVEQAG